MTLTDLLNCSRPLYLEADIQGIDYGQVGSSLLIRKGSLLRVVTARHCLWEKERPTSPEMRETVERLWIPQSLTDTEPVGFGFSEARVASAAKYSAAADIAVVDITSEGITSLVDFCDLGSFPICTPRLGDKLVISGYPKLINDIQYPEDEAGGKLKPRRLLASASFAGEGTAPMLGSMRLDNPNVLSTYNGMSGSPVFRCRERGSRTFVELAGMAVREMTSAGTIDFIPAHVLEYALGFSQAAETASDNIVEVRPFTADLGAATARGFLFLAEPIENSLIRGTLSVLGLEDVSFEVRVAGPPLRINVLNVAVVIGFDPVLRAFTGAAAKIGSAPAAPAIIIEIE